MEWDKVSNRGRGTSDTEKGKVRDIGMEWDKVSNRGVELATQKRERSGIAARNGTRSATGAWN